MNMNNQVSRQIRLSVIRVGIKFLVRHRVKFSFLDRRADHVMPNISRYRFEFIHSLTHNPSRQ